jgi:hypothetical protein
MTDDGKTQLSEAISLAESGDYDTARRLLLQIIAEDRDNEAAHGWLLLIEGKTKIPRTAAKIEQGFGVFWILAFIGILIVFLCILHECSTGGLL